MELIKIKNKQVTIASNEECERLFSICIETFKNDSSNLGLKISNDNEIDAYLYFKGITIFCNKIVFEYENLSKVTLYYMVQCYHEFDNLLRRRIFIDDQYNGIVDITEQNDFQFNIL